MDSPRQCGDNYRRKSSGLISANDLRATLHNYLKAEGHPTEVVEEIFGAMLERVVMIVPRIQGTYEFEVQPLREYFAARFLYDTASYSPTGKERKGTKPDRFERCGSQLLLAQRCTFLRQLLQ
ncbi:hypothetical protein [Bradyrhizobium elkanii]